LKYQSGATPQNIFLMVNLIKDLKKKSEGFQSWLTEYWERMVDANVEYENPTLYHILQNVCDEHWMHINWEIESLPDFNEMERDILDKALDNYKKMWRGHIERESAKADGNYIFHPNFADQTVEDLKLKIHSITPRIS